MSEKYSYQKEWKEHRKRQKTFWLVILGYIPIALLSLSLGYFYENNKIIGVASSSLWVVFLVIFVICGIRLQFWECPRCEHSFHRTWWWNNIFSRKCLHCKLPKYAGSSFGERGKVEL
ncbi:hypothetical protein BH24ACI1_BH24ACI1_17420 [soil metagenome]|jgi:hypothetical protein